MFVNATLDEVAAAADRYELTLVQLHGDEGPAYCREVARRTGARVIKAARVRDAASVRDLEAFHTDFHLLDAAVPGQPGGTGQTFGWELAGAHRGHVPMILAGGMNPDNVAEAIRVTCPVRGGHRQRHRARARAQGPGQDDRLLPRRARPPSPSARTA